MNRKNLINNVIIIIGYVIATILPASYIIKLIEGDIRDALIELGLFIVITIIYIIYFKKVNEKKEPN